MKSYCDAYVKKDGSRVDFREDYHPSKGEDAFVIKNRFKKANAWIIQAWCGNEPGFIFSILDFRTHYKKVVEISRFLFISEIRTPGDMLFLMKEKRKRNRHGPSRMAPRFFKCSTKGHLINSSFILGGDRFHIWSRGVKDLREKNGQLEWVEIYKKQIDLMDFLI
ncbi:MAG: hypothetical protein OXB88_06490 [Bacteriovoracales bacterium]|nr:hypothetical protein [Bacteriovoracales bacterium]